MRGLHRHICHCHERVCVGPEPGRDVCQSTTLINCGIPMCPDRTLHTKQRNQCDSFHPSAVFTLRRTRFFLLQWCVRVCVATWPIKGRGETEDVLQEPKKAFTPYLPAALSSASPCLSQPHGLPVNLSKF